MFPKRCYRIGFTGSSKDPLSDSQKELLTEKLNTILQGSHLLYEVHHGDCVGADKNMHDIAIKSGCSIVIHPPNISTKRAFCTGEQVKILAVKPYLVRNKNIVSNVDILLACPETMIEELRSGTWATIRYARKKKIKIYIFPRQNNKKRKIITLENITNKRENSNTSI
jgi:hypothetical protein